MGKFRDWYEYAMDLVFWLILGTTVIFIILADTPMIANDSPNVFQLETGEKISCEQWQSRNCGISLAQCENGIEYICQTNVQKIS